MTKKYFDQAVDSVLLGRFNDAESICKAILQSSPEDYQTLYLLSSVFLLTGRHEESRDICNNLLSLNFKNSDVYNLLAAISADHDEDDNATESWLKKSLEHDAKNCDALINLGNLRLKNDLLDEAYELYIHAVELGGDTPKADAFFGLAKVAESRKNIDSAIENYRKASKLSPDNLRVLGNLMITLYKSGNEDEAVGIAIKIAQQKTPGLAAIGAFCVLNSLGLMEEAETLLPEVLHQLEHEKIDAQLFMMANIHLMSAYQVTDEQLFKINLRASQSLRKFAVYPAVMDFPKAFISTPRIRIGYLSSDLRSHVVSHFLKPIIAEKDSNRFEVFLYSNLPEEMEDQVTLEYRKLSDHFINVYELSDASIANRIREDGIHILIELNGYTRDSRLSVLAYRPAPVQIGYLGYPFSSCLNEVDYFITDPFLNGPKNKEYFVEKALQLPQSFLCFGKYPEQQVSEFSPSKINGYLTFGSLSSVYKLNKKTIELWSRVLKRVPESRMYLNHPTMRMAGTKTAILNEFNRHGISLDRIQIVTEKHPSGLHLQYYNEIDIVLDTLPLTGGTTTLDALWMGVPIITLVGESHRGRLSYSLISNVGINMMDCISFNENDYVENAVNLSRNQNRLETLHKNLPSAILKSILCSVSTFTRQIESTYMNAWNSKFTETPIESLMTEERYVQLPIYHSQPCKLVLQDDPTNLYTYVIRESREWFEAESAFLARHASNFESFWDFSEDPGMFSIPMAVSQAITGGVTVAYRLPGMVTHLLNQSLVCNQINNLHIVQNPEKHELPDLVRFSVDFNDGEGNLITPCMGLVESHSPLFVVSLNNAYGRDLSALPIFAEKGYQAYRLLPGYDLLIPHHFGDSLQASDINLFFCKGERAKALSAAGILCFESVALENLPNTQDRLWADLLKNCAYVSAHIKNWINNPIVGKWGDMYLFALNLYSQAKNTDISPPQRYASIKMLESVITLLLQSEANVPRLLSGIRIMVDAGKRDIAIQWLTALISGLDGDDEQIFNEPFLAPDASCESLPISMKEVDWALSVSLVSREKLSRFSSWFTESQGLEIWKNCALKFPWLEEQCINMIQVIEQRLNSEITKKSPSMSEIVK